MTKGVFLCDIVALTGTVVWVVETPSSATKPRICFERVLFSHPFHTSVLDISRFIIVLSVVFILHQLLVWRI